MNTHIHRLLDETFDGIEMTSETRELKEEIRANLMARTTELEATGLAPANAARKAIDELGPMEDLLKAGPSTGVRTPNPSAATAAELLARNKVRPNPGFVVRTTLLSVAAAGALTLAVLAGFEVIDGGTGAVFALGLAAAAMLGFVTADSLRQETSANYAMPTGRAVGWGLATFAGVTALAAFGAFAANTSATGLAVVGGALLLGSIALFAWLGATQTNRHKQWLRATDYEPNRFETDQAAAARFGIYNGIIWMVGIGAAIWLGIAFAWWWALVALCVCTVVTLLMVANMLFVSPKDK